MLEFKAHVLEFHRSEVVKFKPKYQPGHGKGWLRRHAEKMGLIRKRPENVEFKSSPDFPEPPTMIVQFEEQPPLALIEFAETGSFTKFRIMTPDYVFENAWIYISKPIDTLTYKCTCDYWTRR